MESAPLPYGGAALLPAHEIEDRLAVLNVRRILADPKALKARKEAGESARKLADRQALRDAMSKLDLMRPGG